tara:strand:+ start:21234 stop:22028 length:795 start_codon:yes stop_codon:yes gene_type:complete
MNVYLENFSLEGKNAYITGGLGLIGREISIALALSGAKTIVLDIKKKIDIHDYLDLRLKQNNNLCYEYLDVSDLKDIDKKINTLVANHGTPDIWINNAYPKTQDWGNSIEQLSLESFRKNVDMHMNSYSWISRQICFMMKTNKRGSLINIGSIYGFLGNDLSIYEDTGINVSMTYATIKGGIINLTRHLASFFGEYNIRVNNICPGGVFDNQNDVFVKQYSKKTPLRRMASPIDIAPAVVFIASDAASYITGSTIVIDGGWSIT